jgi:hypothetical protein
MNSVVMLSVALAALLAFAACASDEDGGGAPDPAADEEAVRETILSAVEAWNGKDADGFLDLVTDNYIQAVFNGTREEAEQALPQLIGEPPFEDVTVSNIDVSGDGATAEFASRIGNVLSRDEESLVRDGDSWLLDSEAPLVVEIPASTATVEVVGREFAFDFDASQVSNGDIAFSFSNGGGEPHFLFLAKIPEDLDVEQALGSQVQPEGIEDIGRTDTLEAGGETTMVFAQPLEPGRYAMFCFIETADGTPHANQGMWADFTVPG